MSGCAAVPSTAFPKLGTENVGFRGRAPKVYSLAQLKQLVSYADTRGAFCALSELRSPP